MNKRTPRRDDKIQRSYLVEASYQTAYFWLMTKLEKVTDEAALIVSQAPPPHPSPSGPIAATDNNNNSTVVPTAPVAGTTTPPADQAAVMQAMMDRHYQMMADMADTFPQGRPGGMAAAQQQQQFSGRRGTRGSSSMRGLPPFRTPIGGVTTGFGFGFPSTPAPSSAAVSAAALPSFLQDNNDTLSGGGPISPQAPLSLPVATVKEDNVD